MASPILGDLSQHYQSLRQGTAIKSRLAVVAQELSSGHKADLSGALRGNTAPIAVLDRDLALLDAFDRTTAQLAQHLSEQQIVLGTLDAAQTTLGARLLTITPSASLVDLSTAETAGRDGFRRIVDLLNTRLGDRSLFAGAQVTGTAVADADTMLADLLVSIGGATDAAGITTAIDTWFDDPAGGYATSGYLGDTGPHVAQRVGPDDLVMRRGRADDPGIKTMLKAGAMAAVAAALSPGLSHATRATLLRTSGERMLGAADGVRQIAARIGEDEQRLDELSTQRAAQRTTYGVTRNALVLADPFATAALLQEVQQQLELHYTATARLSRLSLASYL